MYTYMHIITRTHRDIYIYIHKVNSRLISRWPVAAPCVPLVSALPMLRNQELGNERPQAYDHVESMWKIVVLTLK